MKKAILVVFDENTPPEKMMKNFDVILGAVVKNDLEYSEISEVRI